MQVAISTWMDSCDLKFVDGEFEVKTPIIYDNAKPTLHPIVPKGPKPESKKLTFEEVLAIMNDDD